MTGPFDLFCGSTGEDGQGASHLLVLSGNVRLQTIAVYAIRTLFGLLVLVAASSRSAIPLDIGAGAAGLLLLALPLRSFSTARAVAPVLWVCTLACAVGVREDWIGSQLGDDIEIGVACLVALALIGAVALSAADAAELPIRGVATALAFAFVAGVLCAASALGLGSTVPSVTTIMLVACMSALGAVLVGSLIAGLLRGVGVVQYRRVFRGPSRLERPSIPIPGTPERSASPDFAERMLFAVQWTAARIAIPIARAAKSTIDAVFRAVEAVRLAVALAAHYFLVGVMWIGILLVAAVTNAFTIVRAAAQIALSVGRRWAQTTVLGLALFSLCAAAAVAACSLFSSYIGGSTLLDGVGSFALAIPSVCGLVAIWWTLTKCPARHVTSSALHTAEVAGPTIFLTAVALGWIDGIIGLLGFGSLRPGYLTFAGTAIVAAVLIVAYRNKTAPAKPSGAS